MVKCGKIKINDFHQKFIYDARTKKQELLTIIVKGDEIKCLKRAEKLEMVINTEDNQSDSSDSSSVVVRSKLKINSNTFLS